MIQRIQSIWLLLAGLCAFATFKFSFYSGTNAKGETSYQLKAGETMLLTITALLIVIISFIAIALYKKRSLQITLSIAGTILTLIILFLFFRQTQSYSIGAYSLTAVLPIFSIAFFILAILSIRKDEKLIKSTDRLR